MLLNAFQHSFSVDQQQKIMQQIQVINKKLNSNPYSIKHLQPHPHQIKLQKVDEKYFSQQCEQLFSDEHYPKDKQGQDSFDDSLFSSKNSLLLGNQYEKEIKNFKEFETDKYSSQNRDKINFGKDSKQQNAKYFEPMIQDNLFQKKEAQIQTDRNTSQSQSQLQSAMISKTSSKSRIKSIAESKIKKYIENKENILPASNLQPRDKSFIKQVRKKIRFQTQPDCYQYDQQKEDSLEGERFDQLYPFANNNSRSRMKYDSSKNTLQCTFKPNILKKSSQIAENLQPSFERLTQDISVSKSQSKLPYKTKQELSTKKYSVKRLQQMSQPRKLKTLADHEEPKYDFRPSLSKKSLQQMANCTMDVASRNKLWLQQRQAKVAKLKVQEQQKKLKQQLGSYAPKITPYKGERQVHLSRYAKQGISSYFQRVSMAKQKHQTLEKKKPQPKQQMKESNVNMKKKTYDEAVRELHKKIMAINL